MSGSSIQCRASVTWALECEPQTEEILVAPPQFGEVRVKILYSSLCHSDLRYWKDVGPYPLPMILGHEGSGVVESVGEGVEEFHPGDPVITLFQPECKKCKLCKLEKTNLCESALKMPRSMYGLMPGDGKTRFTSLDGRPIHHFLNCSTFSEYTVVLESSLAKISPDFPLSKACLLSCGVPTGLGSVCNIAKVEAGSTTAVIGLGTVGLAAVRGCKLAGASKIIAIDVEPSKFELAKALGATDCINPKDHPDSSLDVLVHGVIEDGVDYSFECVGNPELVLAALNCCTLYGTSVVAGLCSHTDTVTFSPWQLLFGRQWKSGLLGGFKGKSQTEALVNKCENKEIDLDKFITHRLPFSSIAEGFGLLKNAGCVKCVFHVNDEVV